MDINFFFILRTKDLLWFMNIHDSSFPQIDTQIGDLFPGISMHSRHQPRSAGSIILASWVAAKGAQEPSRQFCSWGVRWCSAKQPGSGIRRCPTVRSGGGPKRKSGPAGNNRGKRERGGGGAPALTRHWKKYWFCLLTPSILAHRQQATRWFSIAISSLLMINWSDRVPSALRTFLLKLLSASDVLAWVGGTVGGTPKWPNTVTGYL